MAEEKIVNLTSPDRVLYPGDGVTKGDVFEYYKQVGPTIVPHLKDRPFTMKRYPHGITGQAFMSTQFICTIQRTASGELMSGKSTNREPPSRGHVRN